MARSPNPVIVLRKALEAELIVDGRLDLGYLREFLLGGRVAENGNRCSGSRDRPIDVRETRIKERVTSRQADMPADAAGPAEVKEIPKDRVGPVKAQDGALGAVVAVATVELARVRQVPLKREGAALPSEDPTVPQHGGILLS